jgi:hypothetical protein
MRKKIAKATRKPLRERLKPIPFNGLGKSMRAVEERLGVPAKARQELSAWRAMLDAWDFDPTDIFGVPNMAPEKRYPTNDAIPELQEK